MIPLKPIAPSSVSRALDKAERYRLLNEPSQAESICLDIVSLEPGHQPALVCLLLALTDQFFGHHGQGHGRAGLLEEARAVLGRLDGDYARTYYAGIIAERWGRRLLHLGQHGARFGAYQYLHEAMALYEKADQLAPEENDDAVLRWNTCARTVDQEKLVPPPPPEAELPLE